MKKILNLHCSQCDRYLLTYRKDGAGNLLKIYLDRILEPPAMASLKCAETQADLTSWVCLQCGQRLGIPMLDKSNKRLAFRVIRGALSKKRL